MKRLYLVMLLGAMTVISCAKVVPEDSEEERNQPEQVAQGLRLSFRMDGISMLEIESVDGYPLGLDGNSIITYSKNLVLEEVYGLHCSPEHSADNQIVPELLTFDI